MAGGDDVSSRPAIGCRDVIRNLIDTWRICNPELHLTDELWRKVQSTADTLLGPTATTARLQATDLTPGEFEKEWTLLKRQLRGSDGLGSAIADAMERRQRTLFECEVFLAAVYVDVRYRLLLDESDIRLAERAFTSVVYRERQLKGMEKAAESGALADGSTGSKEGSASSEDELERALDALQQQRQQGEDERQPSLKDDLEKVSKLPRTKCKTASEGIAGVFPAQIQPAALAVTALPVTQVSVERLFSALKFIVSDARSSMKPDLVEAVLLLRTNW